MNMPAVRFVFLRDAAELYGAEGLAYATPGSVGLDLRACFEPAEGETTPPGDCACRRAWPSSRFHQGLQDSSFRAAGLAPCAG